MRIISLEAKLEMLDEDVTTAKQVADQSKSTSELLFNTMKDSFSKIDEERDSLRNLIRKKDEAQKTANLRLETSFFGNLTHLERQLASFGDISPFDEVFNRLGMLDQNLGHVKTEVSALGLDISNNLRHLERQSNQVRGLNETLGNIQSRIQVVSRQGLENQAVIKTLEPISKGHHSLNQDLFEKLGAIQIELNQMDEEFRKLSDDLHGELDMVETQISKLTVDGAAMKNGLKSVTTSMDGVIDAIQSDSKVNIKNI